MNEISDKPIEIRPENACGLLLLFTRSSNKVFMRVVRRNGSDDVMYMKHVPVKMLILSDDEHDFPVDLNTGEEGETEVYFEGDMNSPSDLQAFLSRRLFLIRLLSLGGKA